MGAKRKQISRSRKLMLIESLGVRIAILISFLRDWICIFVKILILTFIINNLYNENYITAWLLLDFYTYCLFLPGNTTSLYCTVYLNWNWNRICFVLLPSSSLSPSNTRSGWEGEYWPLTARRGGGWPPRGMKVDGLEGWKLTTRRNEGWPLGGVEVVRVSSDF